MFVHAGPREAMLEAGVCPSKRDVLPETASTLPFASLLAGLGRTLGASTMAVAPTAL